MRYTCYISNECVNARLLKLAHASLTDRLEGDAQVEMESAL